MFAGLVERGSRSPSTMDEYRYLVARVIVPGVGSLRLAEVTTPRLDRFVQAVLANRGYAAAKQTRSALSGICGWLVRRGALPVEPVRDLTPLEQNRDRAARALSVEEMRQCFAVLDDSEFAQRHDLPELARFMLATGLRLGEALGVTWADVDLAARTVGDANHRAPQGPGPGGHPGEVEGVRTRTVDAAVVCRADSYPTSASGRLRWPGVPGRPGRLARSQQRRQGFPAGAARRRTSSG